MKKYTNKMNGITYFQRDGKFIVEQNGVEVVSYMDQETFDSMIANGEMVEQVTLEQVLEFIDRNDVTGSSWLLTCGATHLAVDSDGGIYGYRSKPVQDPVFCGGSWRGPCNIWCGDLEPREDWRNLIWELP